MLKHNSERGRERERKGEREREREREGGREEKVTGQFIYMLFFICINSKLSSFTSNTHKWSTRRKLFKTKSPKQRILSKASL